MGYYSTISPRNLVISAPKPATFDEESKAKETALKALQEQAAALGAELKLAEDPEHLRDTINGYLFEHKNNFGFWFLTAATGDPHRVELDAVGDSGKAYDFESELKEFAEFLKENGLSMSGDIFRSGEEQGDLTRYRVRENTIATEQAKLMFSDGEVYED